MSHKGRRSEYDSESDEPPRKVYSKKHKDYSDSDSEPPKEKERTTRKGTISIPKDDPLPPMPEPIVSQPKRVKLSQSRRLEIITNKRNGIEDPEYSAVQNPATGAWRVAKRKTMISPTAKVEATAGPPGHDMLVTWMNMQQNENQGLKEEIRKLGKKYEKIASKYEEKKKKPKPKPEEAEDEEVIEPPKPRPTYTPPPHNPPPQRPVYQAPQPSVRDRLKYARRGPIDVHRF
jgi:hypothetical protein